MDHSFDKTHREQEQEPVFIDYFLDDPEQLGSTPPPLGQTPFFSTAGSAVDHLQGGCVRHGGGDHAMPVGHRTTPTSAHPPLPPPPLPPHLATEPRPQSHQQARHERLIPEPLFRGHHLQSPIFGSGLHVNAPAGTAPSAIQPHHDDWAALPDFSAGSLAFPSRAEAFLEPPVGATNVIDFGLGGATTNHHDYTDNITPLPSAAGHADHARTTLDHFDFDFAFPSPSWGPSLDDAMSSSLAVAVGAGTTSHPRSALDDESDHRDTFWADEDSSSVGGRPSPSTAARRRLPKGKHRADSLDGASSSIFSTGTDDTGGSHAAGAADLSPGLLPHAGHGSEFSPSPGTITRTEPSHHPGPTAAGRRPPQQQKPKSQPAAADTAEDQAERRVSKAEVLERARLHIEALEREREALRREREELLRNLADMEQDVSVRMGEGAFGDSLRQSPATEEEEDEGQAEREDK
ncbi:predicted protein [Verticillium alfalfae VaMs.102]|uniref:Predicted protein n=1 Tax=Verticillium alfalfae (strain VaMs.102 / ATCC MYA-4576 / FGSC 10136) TaxID=526221 RepID=C9SUU1_VERA1|nr:predicted protein [Verticillium alfalfae VaMs.102]EEY22556.1 predicted protein [Verticillium alfalfae VaMs.102]